MFNRSLLDKWLWRHVHERGLVERFGCSWVGGVLMSLLGVYGVVLWKNLMRGWRKFSTHTRLEVGDGSKVRFWHDL
jgi:hypothetical protein